jgi:TRAP-type uncharacterized transport system fused permease subunit
LRGPGWAGMAVIAVALCFSSYQLVVAAFHPLSSLVMRSLHVGFLLLLTFLLYPATREGARHGRIAGWEWALAVAPSCSPATSGYSKPT